MLAGRVRLGGTGPTPGTLWVTDEPLPGEPGDRRPCGTGAVHLVDLLDPSWSRNVFEAECFGTARILHGRFAIGAELDRESCTTLWRVVTLEGAFVSRRFLRRPVEGSGDGTHWIEGPYPLAYYVENLRDLVRIYAVDLETLSVRWQRNLLGRHASAVADEAGRLFVTRQVSGGEPALTALGDGGATLWERSGHDFGGAQRAHGGEFWAGDLLLEVHEIGPGGIRPLAEARLPVDVADIQLVDEALVILGKSEATGRDVLHAVPLPGVRPAQEGWLHAAGNGGGNGAPQKRRGP